MFASRLNYKVKDYVAWRPDPGAKFTDAFCVNWEPYFFYGFPPFSLISQCLKKIEEDKATGVLIVPYWTTQAWFTILKNLLIDSGSSTVRQSVTITSNRGTTPSSEKNETYGMQAIRTSLLQRHVSGKAAEIIIDSWAATSLKQYQPYLQTWLKLCREWEINPYDPPLTKVLDFLTSLYPYFPYILSLHP